jgi:hypothetical protein
MSDDEPWRADIIIAEGASCDGPDDDSCDGLADHIISTWRKGQRRPTIVLCVNVAHSVRVRDELLRSGVRAEHMNQSMPKAERDAILARFHSGETEVVTDCIPASGDERHGARKWKTASSIRFKNQNARKIGIGLLRSRSIYVRPLTLSSMAKIKSLFARHYAV